MFRATLAILLTLAATDLAAFECREYTEPMRILGSADIGLGYASEMNVQGDVVYAIHHGNRFLVVVDAADLAAPEQVLRLDYGSAVTGFDVGPAGLLVTVTGVGLIRHDLSDPLAPVPTDTLDLGVDLLDVALAEDTAFVSTSNGRVRAVALNYPGGMLPLGSYQLASTAQAIDHDDGWLYAGTFGHGLVVLNVSDPGSIQFGGAAGFSGQASSIHIAHDRIALGGHGAPGGGGIVTVYDVSTPFAPQHVGSVIDPLNGHVPPTGTIGAPDHLYVASAPNGLGEYYLEGGTYQVTGVLPSTATHFIADGERFFLLDFNSVHTGFMGQLQPGPATEINIASTNAILRDDYIYAQVAYTLAVIDVSDGSAPAIASMTQIGSGNISTPTNALLGPAYYATRQHGGIDIVNVEDPANPIHVGIAPLPSLTSGMLAENELLFGLRDDWGLQVVDISDPWDPQSIGFVALAMDGCRGMVLDGDQLLAACRPVGIDVFDVSDPTQPFVADPIPCGPVSHFIRDGARLLVALESGPLETWINEPAAGGWIRQSSGPVTDVIRLTKAGPVGYALHVDDELSVLDLRGSATPVRTGGFPVWPLVGSTVLAADGWLAYSRQSTFYFHEPQCPFDLTAAPPVALPSPLALTAAPNPFNPSTRFTFTAPRPGDASLRIYDLRGRLVDTLLAGPVSAGTHHADWRGTDRTGRPVPSGVYHARLTVGGVATNLKVSLLK